MADYVIAGSGINALVAASLLALKGRKVIVLERNPVIGGCIRTEEATVPGFTHDVMATTFVLFLLSPAYAALATDLEQRAISAETNPPGRNARSYGMAQRATPSFSKWFTNLSGVWRWNARHSPAGRSSAR